MSGFRVWLVFFAFLMVFVDGTASAAATQSEHAVVAMRGVLPVGDFARRAAISSPRLSPDGKHLLVRMDDADGKHHSLVVYQLSDMSVVGQLNMPIYKLPLSPMWADNQWIVMEVGRAYGSLDAPLRTGEVISSTLDGKRQQYLYGPEARGRRASTRGADQGFGFIGGRPVKPNGHVYVRAMPFGREKLSVLYDVDASSNARKLMVHMKVAGMSFLMGPDGEPAWAWGNNAGFNYVAYRQSENGWQAVDFDKMGEYFEPVAYTEDNAHMYAYVNKDEGPAALVKVSPAGGARTVLAKNAFASVGNIQWTASPERPFAVFPLAGVPEPIFMDPNQRDAKLYRALAKAFPDRVVHFITFSQDRSQLLFSLSSDRDPGSYYLMDMATHKVGTLFGAMPWIKPLQMAERTPVRFKAGDGVELEAILTFPLHRSHANLPMVLVPHGGPHGVRDQWYFDADAQFLANRGYLVLQVNFRGSGGRGMAFQAAGYRQWGTRIQQDLIDGVEWAIKQGYADRKRICVYGASFGGYSAMMSVIRAPELFQCAIGYAGIYDLQMMYEKGDIQQRETGRSYLAAVIGTDKAELASNSPAKLANQIRVPVFLAHGKEDQRAPFAQAKAMRAALKSAGKAVEWMAVDGEGHGFYTEEHRTEFLTRLQAFLEKSIGPGAPAEAPGDVAAAVAD